MLETAHFITSSPHPKEVVANIILISKMRVRSRPGKQLAEITQVKP